jgi:hypothetical protein
MLGMVRETQGRDAAVGQLGKLQPIVNRPRFDQTAAVANRRAGYQPNFSKTARSGFLVGRSPWTAADAHAGLLGLDELISLN